MARVAKRVKDLWPPVQSAGTRIRKLLPLLAVVIVAFLIFQEMTSYQPRISYADANSRLEDLERQVTSGAEAALDSGDRAATLIDFGGKTVTPAYVVSLNRMAHAAAKIRDPLLGESQLAFDRDLLGDVAGLVKALDGCGSGGCTALSDAVEAFKASLFEVARERKALGDLGERSYALLRTPPADEVSARTELLLLLKDATSNPEMLTHDSGHRPLEDVDRHMAALRRLVQIHQDLAEESAARHRIAGALHLVLGQL